MSNLGDKIQNAIDEFNDLATGGDWRSTQEDTFLPALKSALDGAVAEEGFGERIRNIAAGFLSAGTNVSLDRDDGANTLTISATDTDTQLSEEQVRTAIAAFVAGGENTTVSYDDADDSLTINGLSNSAIAAAIAGLDIGPDKVESRVIDTEQTPAENIDIGTGSGNDLAEWANGSGGRDAYVGAVRSTNDANYFGISPFSALPGGVRIASDLTVTGDILNLGDGSGGARLEWPDGSGGRDGYIGTVKSVSKPYLNINHSLDRAAINSNEIWTEANLTPEFSNTLGFDSGQTLSSLATGTSVSDVPSDKSIIPFARPANDPGHAHGYTVDDFYVNDSGAYKLNITETREQGNNGECFYGLFVL